MTLCTKRARRRERRVDHDLGGDPLKRRLHPADLQPEGEPQPRLQVEERRAGVRFRRDPGLEGLDEVVMLSVATAIGRSTVSVASTAAQPVQVVNGTVGSVPITVTGASGAALPTGTISYTVLNSSGTGS